MKSSPPQAGIDGIVGGSEPKTVSLKQEKQEVSESAELLKEDSLDLNGSDEVEESAEPTKKSTSSADETEEDHNVVIKLPSFNIPEFKFPNWKNAKSKLPSVKLPKMKVSPKIVITIGLMVMVGGGVFVGLPKAQDYMAVKSALEEAKSLSEIGDYNKAEKTLASALDNWAFGSQKENLNDLLDKQRQNKAYERQLEEARKLRKEGSSQQARKKLTAIARTFPEYDLVKEELAKLEESENKKDESVSSTSTEASLEVEQQEGKFKIGEQVRTTINLHARTNPSVSAESTANESKGSTGSILDGPEEGETFTWWQVAYESGTTGWSAEKYLEPVSEDTEGVEDGSDDADNVEDESEEAPQEASTKFNEGQDVQTTRDLSVREESSTSGEKLGVADGGLRGTVVGGPEYGDDLWWWKVEYSGGLTGWSAENFLTEAKEKPDSLPAKYYDKGDRVETTSNLKVRAEPSTSAGVETIISAGSVGSILDGPEYGDDLWWWKVDYDKGYIGWGAEGFLEESMQEESSEEPADDETESSSQPEEPEEPEEPAEPTYLEEAERIYDAFRDIGKEIVGFIDDYSSPDDFESFQDDKIMEDLERLKDDAKAMEELDGYEEGVQLSQWLYVTPGRCYREALQHIDKAESESRGEDGDDSQVSAWLFKARQSSYVKCDPMDDVEDYLE